MHREFRWGEQFAWHSPEIDDDADIEAFVVVEYGIRQPTWVGRSWLMPFVHVGHDAIVGNGCELASRAVVAAHCVVGDGARLGIGTVMRPGVKIGEGARTGCGAVVIKDIPAGQVWAGNPARPLRACTPAVMSIQRSELSSEQPNNQPE